MAGGDGFPQYEPGELDSNGDQKSQQEKEQSEQLSEMDKILDNVNNKRSKSAMLMPHEGLEFDKSLLPKTTSQKKVPTAKEKKEKARQDKIDRMNNAHFNEKEALENENGEENDEDEKEEEDEEELEIQISSYFSGESDFDITQWTYQPLNYIGSQVNHVQQFAYKSIEGLLQ